MTKKIEPVIAWIRINDNQIFFDSWGHDLTVYKDKLTAMEAPGYYDKLIRVKITQIK